MEAHVLKRLFTVDEFHQMAQAGVLREDDRVELLEGEIVRMTPIGSRHAACVARLTEVFVKRCRAAAIVNVQNPMVLSSGTELYPDITLLERRADFYSGALPTPLDVLLVVEVADTTGDYDRGIKVPLYARAGIPEVWIVDLREGCIDVYRGPAAGEYGEQSRGVPGESLPIPRIEGEHLQVSDVLA